MSIAVNQEKKLKQLLQERREEILEIALNNTSDIKKGEQKSYSSDKVQVMNQSTK